MPNFANLVRLDEIAPVAAAPVMERDEGQTWLLENYITPYLDTPAPDYMLVLAPAPAFGKTHLMAMVSDHVARRGKRVFWAMPRHDMYPALLEEVRRIKGDPALWMEWLPRNNETCKWSYRSMQWLERGNSLFDFCKAACGIAYMQNECIYHGQARSPTNIVCGHHNHVFLGHALMQHGTFDLIIGDESPYDAARGARWIPKWQLSLPDTPRDNPLYDILKRFSETPGTEIAIRGGELFEIAGGERAVYEACKAYESYKRPKRTIYRHDIEVNMLRYDFEDDLVRLLRQDLDAYSDYGDDGIFRVLLHEYQLGLCIRREPHRNLPPHVVWLDATPSQALYEQVFRRRAEIVRLELPRKGKVYQVASRRNGIKHTLRWNEDKTERLPTTMMTEAVMQVNHIVREMGYERYAVASYKAAKLDFYSSPVSYIHFGGNRGLNRLREAQDAPQALFIIGTPQPPHEAVRQVAEDLWDTRGKAFDETYAGSMTPFAGTDYATMKWDYADPVLREILWSKRDAELIQTAHRVGLNTREVDVWLLSSLPVEGLAPDRIFEIRDLFELPEGYSWQLWTQAIFAAEEIAGERGFVTSTALARRVGCTTKTAWRMISLLAEEFGWSDVKLATGKRIGVGMLPDWVAPRSLAPDLYLSLLSQGSVAIARQFAKRFRIPHRAAQDYLEEMYAEGYPKVKVAIPKRAAAGQVGDTV